MTPSASHDPTRPEAVADVRVHMAEALAAVAGLLVEVRDTAILAQRVVDEVRRLFGALGALMCRLNTPTQTLEAIAVSGDIGSEYGTHLVFAPGMGTPGLAAMTPKPVITANVLTDARITLPDETRVAIEHAPFRAVLAVPLLLQGVVIGTLCILDREGRDFTEEEARFAQAFAHQAALALENARLYEAMEAASAEALAANRAKDDFLAVLSHELRGPLHAIFGWARMLRAGQLDKRAVDRAIEAIERNSLLQTQLINDLLDVSRIVAGRLEVTLRPVALLPTVMTAVDSLRQDADAKGVGLVVRRESDDCAVAGDPFRLHQIMTNLIGNAVKFTPPGGDVDIAVARHGSDARITVRDAGRGISADLLPHIFDRFRQGERGADPNERGLGLGLSIVRHLVELHGGTVTAESGGLGHGATFTVVLPTTNEAIEPSAQWPDVHDDARREASGSAEWSLRGVNLLVVEDDRDARELIVLVLREHGADAIPAASIADAVYAMARSRPDLIVSDLGLPDGDGYQLIERVREIQRTHARPMIPAIALTGFGGESERRRALAAGYQAHIVKPVDPFHLVEIVGKALGRSPRELRTI